MANKTLNDLREIILTNELGDRMLDMVAPIYNNSRVTLHLFQAIGITLEKDQKFMSLEFDDEDNFISQIFLQTATWGLVFWEDEYGITPDPSWNYEQRRQNIIRALQYKAPITPKKIEERLSAMTGLEIKVTENVAPNTIKVDIETYTPDYSTVNKLLDTILPAHLYYRTNINDIVNSKAISYHGITVNEIETVDVIVN